MLPIIEIPNIQVDLFLNWFKETMKDSNWAVQKSYIRTPVWTKYGVDQWKIETKFPSKMLPISQAFYVYSPTANWWEGAYWD